MIGIAPSAAVQSNQLTRGFDNRRGRVPILQIKENQSLTKKLCFMIDLDLQSPLHVFGTDSTSLAEPMSSRPSNYDTF